MGLIAIFGGFALVAFLVTVIARRAYTATALVIGSIPAAVVAIENLPELLNPLSWFILLPIWALGVTGALVGAWLARMVHSYWRSA